MWTGKTDQIGQMPRLICAFAGRTLTLLVLSCRGSFCELKSARLDLRVLQEMSVIAFPLGTSDQSCHGILT